MDRVGGRYSELLLLERDAVRYDELLIVMAGEADARRLMELRQRAEGGGHGR